MYDVFFVQSSSIDVLHNGEAWVFVTEYMYSLSELCQLSSLECRLLHFLHYSCSVPWSCLLQHCLILFVTCLKRFFNICWMSRPVASGVARGSDARRHAPTVEPMFYIWHCKVPHFAIIGPLNSYKAIFPWTWLATDLMSILVEVQYVCHHFFKNSWNEFTVGDISSFHGQFSFVPSMFFTAMQ